MSNRVANHMMRRNAKLHRKAVKLLCKKCQKKVKEWASPNCSECNKPKEEAVSQPTV